MPYDIEGWVEVTKTRGADQDDEHAWLGLIDISALSLGPGAASEILFGLSERCSTGGHVADALASNRGLPLNPSDMVRAEMGAIAELEREFGDSGCGGFTHASWSAIKEVLSDEDEARDAGWSLLFAMVRAIDGGRYGGYSDDQIRFVAWFNW